MFEPFCEVLLQLTDLVEQENLRCKPGALVDALRLLASGIGDGKQSLENNAGWTNFDSRVVASRDLFNR